MNNRIILLALTILVIVISSCCVVSAMDLKEINFNVSSELKPDEGVGLQFRDNDGNSLIITEEEVGDLSSDYTKINETVFLYNHTIHGDEIKDANGKVLGKMIDVHNFQYGEYFKIDGKTYLVSTSGSPTEPDYNKSLEYLNYFNGHNSFEPIKILIN